MLQLFHLNDKAKSLVAGVQVLTGHLRTGDEMVYRIKRKGEVILEESEKGVAGLRRFKDKVSEVCPHD